MRDGHDENQELSEEPLNSEFLKNMIVEVSGSLQTLVGPEDSHGFLSVTGANVARWLNEEHLQIDRDVVLDVRDVAEATAQLENAIGADFYVVSISEEEIVFANRRCPFGKKVNGRQSLCAMTSQIIGKTMAENLGYARVTLHEALAKGDPSCRVVVALKPSENASEPTHETMEYFPLGPRNLAAE